MIFRNKLPDIDIGCKYVVDYYLFAKISSYTSLQLNEVTVLRILAIAII